MSIAQRFKQLDTQASQAPGPTVDDNETLDKALALLRRQQADMKALLEVVKDQNARLVDQDKALTALRKMYAAELAKKATQATQAKAEGESESATKKLLDQRYGKAQP